jgi:hypothetical protein
MNNSNLTPGPAADITIAARVLGLAIDASRRCRTCGAADAVLPFTRSAEAALSLAAALAPRGLALSLTYDGKTFTAQFGMFESAHADTLPMAICEAALNTTAPPVPVP